MLLLIIIILADQDKEFGEKEKCVPKLFQNTQNRGLHIQNQCFLKMLWTLRQQRIDSFNLRRGRQKQKIQMCMSKQQLNLLIEYMNQINILYG
ncbi:unnamed protein product [Paramecium sonneborni]|uniref:Uncharacterized protein n=1 Tax=Paramecium sonneborni TaxID=65129 RepID=A0A8S1RPJ4_9CILI|nr:unnamed protein product [Paramecium sonneborni]